MHTTLSTAEIRCDHCLAQLPPQVGENAVLARIRAAQNGWTTVGYGPTRILMAKDTGHGWKVYLPPSAEFCPSCEPLSMEQWFKLCQKRLVDREHPFRVRKFSRHIELAEYNPPAPEPARPVGQLSIASADRLVRRGDCAWMCLLAMEEICTCRCGGPYHGAAIDALRDLRTVIAAPSDVTTASHGN